MRREAVMEKFFTALISGRRCDARAIIDELLQADCSAEDILTRLCWPTVEHLQQLHRADQLSDLSHHYACRLLRGIVDQMQMRLEQRESNGRKVLLVCGPDESEELSGQMAADLMEAGGYEVYFAGGGIANDELVAEVGKLEADVLAVFGAAASTVPFTRLLIDHLHETGVCPTLQIAVGGGVFNRAEGLAEEIGADLWAKDPLELVQLMDERPDQRMQDEQRTVGRKRRTKREAA